jgi:hypothetical protein
VGCAKKDGQRGITVHQLEDVISVKWTDGDDVFDGLCRGSTRAVGGQIGSESCSVGADKRVTRDEVDEGGEDHSFAAFRALDGGWVFACGQDGEGDVCLGTATVVSPAGAPRVDGCDVGYLPLVADGVEFVMVWQEGRGAIVFVRSPCRARASATSFDGRCVPMT